MEFRDRRVKEFQEKFAAKKQTELFGFEIDRTAAEINTSHLVFPVGRHFRMQRVDDESALFFGLDHFRVPQNAEVMRDLDDFFAQLLRQFTDILGPIEQPLYDPQPIRIGKRLQASSTQFVVTFLFHDGEWHRFQATISLALGWKCSWFVAIVDWFVFFHQGAFRLRGNPLTVRVHRNRNKIRLGGYVRL